MSKLLPLSVAVTVAAVLAGCASTPPEEDPVQIKLNDLDARVARIERVVSNQSLVQLAQNLDSVQQETRRLRGRIDELENSNEQMKKQLAASASVRIIGGGANANNGAYGSAGGAGAPPSAGGAGVTGGDATNAAAGGGSAGAAGSVGAATGAGAAAAAAGSGPGATDVPAGGAGASSVEQSVYSQAFSALKAGSYSIAITGFKDFLTTYPQSPLAENAQYWLGEAYYVTRSYDDAGTAFRTVLQKYPQSRKAPDAMLKLGFTQYEQKRFADSRKTLEDVTQKFPDSDAARLATDRLKRIPANAPKS
ncbi:MAG TPA: tol-pal system protein YbgF [Steroidobacteraceae bacterium]|jgi:tol-pal system protein YbgF